MAKRFTDTGKWDRAWFRRLTPELKCIWIFLCDRCDHAGAWEIDYEAMQFFVGGQTLPDFKEAFGDKITWLDTKRLLINTFVEFQYGDLNPENRVHKSVLNRLEKLAPNKDLISTLKGAKDKDKEKDKDKDKDSYEGGVGETKFRPDLASIYARYPRKEGKSRGLAILKGSVKTSSDQIECNTSLDNFLDHLKRKGTEADFIPHFKTWAAHWRDWLDPNHGQIDRPKSAADLDFEARERAVFEGAQA